MLLADLLRRGRGHGRAAAPLEPRHAGDARRVPRGAGRLPARARGRARRRRCARGSTSTRCAPSTPTTRRPRRRCATRRRCSIGSPRRRRALRARARRCSTTPGIRYELDPTLVRGLDYYTRTLFEFTSDALGAQSGVGGGGRYDGLIEQLGGPPTPGVGLGGRASSGCCWPRGELPARAGARRPVRRARRRRRRGASALRARRRGAPGRAQRAARAGRPLAQGPAQARRPDRRALRCDHRRRCRDQPQGHGDRRAARGRASAVIPTILRGSRARREARARAPTAIRDSWAGELDAERAGTQARVAGWVHRRRDHGGLIFIDLRDRSGIVQLVFHPETAADGPRRGARAALRGRHHAPPARSPGALRRTSTRTSRPARSRSRSTTLEILADAETPPFPLDEDGAVDENLRLRHRSLDLRRAPMQDAHRAAPPRGHDDPRGPRRARLPRDRDAVPDPLDARGRARLPRPGADRSRARSTRCRSRRSCSSSC